MRQKQKRGKENGSHGVRVDQSMPVRFKEGCEKLSIERMKSTSSLYTQKKIYYFFPPCLSVRTMVMMRGSKLRIRPIYPSWVRVYVQLSFWIEYGLARVPRGHHFYDQGRTVWP